MAESLGLTSEAFSPDNLIVDGKGLRTESIIIESGDGVRSRGDLLGRKALGIGSIVAGGSNVGDGTVTGGAIGASARLGDYKLICTAESADAGTFQVFTPDEERLADAEVGVAYVSDHINFTINDGTEDFDVDDEFTVPVEAGSGKYILSLAAAVDGSEDTENMAILADDVDATSEDRTCIAYVAGAFNPEDMTFGTGHSAASVKEGLKQRGIYLKDPVTTDAS